MITPIILNFMRSLDFPQHRSEIRVESVAWNEGSEGPKRGQSGRFGQS